MSTAPLDRDPALARPDAKRNGSAGPPQKPALEKKHHERDAGIEYENGITWGIMGVNGNNYSNVTKTGQNCRFGGVVLFILH